MTASDALLRLARLAGIATEYWDAFGTQRQVSPGTLRALLGAMGFRCASDPDAEASLAAAEEAAWLTPVEAVAVLTLGQERPEILLSVDEATAPRAAEWALTLESGEQRGGAASLDEMRVVATRRFGVARMTRRAMPLPPALPLGYHTLEIRLGEVVGRAVLIVAPKSCHLRTELGEAGRSWGLTTQLYGLRSRRNWGIGDFGDLATLGEGIARHGAQTLGVNPLHALFPAEPRHISPYSPSSRLWLNDLYIDIEAVPEFADSSEIARWVADPEFQRGLAATRDAELVDHAGVASLKRPLFDALFAVFRERATAERRAAFARYCDEGGEVLRRFAIFQALHERALAEGLGFCWRDWPASWRDPASPEIARFAEEQRDRIALFQFLQFEADRQLGEAARRGRAAGLSLGLYRDLAVGVDPNGGEAWADQELLVPGAAIGAPPDPLSLRGQNWGLAPISPVALKHRAYAPFVAALRANMRHAGILRIDHVMALAHLYWVPSGAEATDGAYVDYPFEDLLRILALESRRHRCAVIGEDLGTVPPGFRETMAAANVLSYRVLVFERDAGGSFKPPAEYPSLAAATVGTHDIATLRGYWLGRDISWRERLTLYPDEDARAGEQRDRVAGRLRLLDALEREGLVDERVRHGLLREDGPIASPELIEAVHRYLGRSQARLMLVQIEDLAEEEEQANLPGTVDQHPNWRRKLSRPIEEILADPAVARLAWLIGEARGERQ
jgi:4-alpha-glucanotransferase